ncbi:MAG: hypothetical protein E7223_08055 [Clostridiales bacterium]|nr:hypothetical protein [Clostridiales bacterium]
MKSVYPVKKLPSLDWASVPAAELRHTGWLEPCEVAAKAQLCLAGEDLHVRLEAAEQPVRALVTSPLEPVCNDSCLEFFLAPWEGDPRYFNFEFNPLGTLNLGFGGERASRVRQVVKNPEAVFCPKPFFTETGWGIEFRIPASFLQIYQPGFRFGGEMSGNFYKCGDLTEVPHYLTWAPLRCEQPDYHRPQDFGRLCPEEK